MVEPAPVTAMYTGITVLSEHQSFSCHLGLLFPKQRGFEFFGRYRQKCCPLLHLSVALLLHVLPSLHLRSRTNQTQQGPDRGPETDGAFEAESNKDLHEQEQLRDPVLHICSSEDENQKYNLRTSRTNLLARVYVRIKTRLQLVGRKLNSLKKTLREKFYLTFLPIDYPHSVGEEYLEFQVYDSLQGLCSYLRGVLCTKALLEGAGVGGEKGGGSNKQTTALAATLMWVARDMVGMVTSVIFGSRFSASFSAFIKEWRFFADVANDVGQFLDMLSPIAQSLSDTSTLWVPLPVVFSLQRVVQVLLGASESSTSSLPGVDHDDEGRSSFFRLHWVDTEVSLYLLLLTLSAICKSTCGVAAGAAKLCTTYHFSTSRPPFSPSSRVVEEENSTTGAVVHEQQLNAPSGWSSVKSASKHPRAVTTDPGDIATKEGTQETAVTFLGLLLGMLFASVTEKIENSFVFSWLLFLFLTVLHVVFNYRAVRCLHLRTLNRTRFCLLVEAYVRDVVSRGPRDEQTSKLVGTSCPLSIRSINARETLRKCWEVNLSKTRPRLAELPLGKVVPAAHGIGGELYYAHITVPNRCVVKHVQEVVESKRSAGSCTLVASLLAVLYFRSGGSKTLGGRVKNQDQQTCKHGPPIVAAFLCEEEEEDELGRTVENNFSRSPLNSTAGSAGAAAAIPRPASSVVLGGSRESFKTKEEDEPTRNTTTSSAKEVEQSSTTTSTSRSRTCLPLRTSTPAEMEAFFHACCLHFALSHKFATVDEFQTAVAKQDFERFLVLLETYGWDTDPTTMKLQPGPWRVAKG
ncbi:unnamed protein product [Amoebophrya sp. A120]|nr:unnamed protein product [Amoebophrya sp. A120]|eukprot:GSA120T00007100001.1